MSLNLKAEAPQKAYRATFILLFINLIVFLLMALNGTSIIDPSSISLIEWGADYGPLTLTGDWWRTITCNFVHIGIFHLLMNMYAFLFIGIMLEQQIGFRRMFIAYLLTGLGSSAVSLFMHGDLVSAGASGSIFGLYGIFLAFLCFHRIEKGQRNALLSSILIFVGYNLMDGMKEGSNNAAHIGGLISGFLLGMAYVAGLRYEKLSTRRMISFGGEAGLLCIFIFCFALLVMNMPDDYEEIRKEWDSVSMVDGKERIVVDEIPSYTPVGNYASWLTYFDNHSGFSCQYPSNWYRLEDMEKATDKTNTTVLFLVNGTNQFTVTVTKLETDDEFENMKKLALTMPKNEQGKTAEGYKRDDVNINGASMAQIISPLIVADPNGNEVELQQKVLYYFQKDKKRITSIVILLYEKEEAAVADLNAITQSIHINQ